MDSPVKKVLLTGATGYIGYRLLLALVKENIHVYCLVRGKNRLHITKNIEDKVSIIDADLIHIETLQKLPKDIDAAYFLVHSMSQGPKKFETVDKVAAENFSQAIQLTNCRQVIYLSGLVNDHNLSKHLRSRMEVESILKQSNCPVTVLRAGIIIGSGSASFEIMRDLVEKLPIMVVPKWVSKRCQPIALRDTLFYLTSVLGNNQCINQVFDIGGPDILTYKQMLLKVANIRGLKRYIFKVPVLTPKLSSYWLYFITTANYHLARSLVDSLKNDAICSEHRIREIIPRKCLSFQDAVKKAIDRVEENAVISSWKDSFSSSGFNPENFEYIQIPKHGCYIIEACLPIKEKPNRVSEVIFSIGGKNGWYFLNRVWIWRGWIDRLLGGVGLRRGRTHRSHIRAGDALDFWRVLLADTENHRLLLFSEMKTPGEAWLELRISKEDNQPSLTLKGAFRPKGVLGRLYWWSLYPIHLILFKGLCRAIIKKSQS